MEYENGYIQKLDVSEIDENMFMKLYEIERDTWAFFMGEYVSCVECNNVDSKKNIYGKIDGNYNLKTVCQLEEEHGRENVRCTCCGGKTEDIRGKNFIPILESRIFTNESFVNLFRSKVDEILGFSYGFIDTPEGIYEREFKSHFSEKLCKLLIQKFGNSNMLTLSGVCISEKEKDLRTVFELIKHFFCSLDGKYDNLTGIGEVILGSPAQKLYSGMGAKSLKINGEDFFVSEAGKILIETDIFYLHNTPREYKQKKDIKLGEVLSKVNKIV